MRNIVKLYEALFPGTIIGRRVSKKDGYMLGVCAGVMMDLDAKKTYIIVARKNFLLRIPIEKIVGIEDGGIVVDVDYELPEAKNPSEDVENLGEEKRHVGNIMHIFASHEQNEKKQCVPRSDMAKLLHIV